MGQEETIIKPLAFFLRRGAGFAGAIISGDGRVVLALDPTTRVAAAEAA